MVGRHCRWGLGVRTWGSVGRALLWFCGPAPHAGTAMHKSRSQLFSLGHWALMGVTDDDSTQRAGSQLPQPASPRHPPHITCSSHPNASSPPTCLAGTPPAPRSAHVAVAYQGRYLLVFGGGSVAHCYDTLHCLDTQTMEWSELEAEGPVPPPRAGESVECLGG